MFCFQPFLTIFNEKLDFKKKKCITNKWRIIQKMSLKVSKKAFI